MLYSTSHSFSEYFSSIYTVCSLSRESRRRWRDNGRTRLSPPRVSDSITATSFRHCDNVITATSFRFRDIRIRRAEHHFRHRITSIPFDPDS
eukprot:1155560-Heterocapsa_arctica.AAC.1